MKQLRVATLLAVFAVLAGCHSQPQPPATQLLNASALTVADLSSRNIIGELGVPLGDLIEGDAILFRGSSLNTKGDEGRYLLQVTRVNGTTLKSPVLMNFTVPGFAMSKLASTEYQLIKNASGKQPTSWSSQDIVALEKGYIGKTVHFTAYEVGGFSGLPRGHVPLSVVWQDHGFGFETELVVLDDHSQDNH